MKNDRSSDRFNSMQREEHVVASIVLQWRIYDRTEGCVISRVRCDESEPRISECGT